MIAGPRLRTSAPIRAGLTTRITIARIQTAAANRSPTVCTQKPGPALRSNELRLPNSPMRMAPALVATTRATAPAAADARREPATSRKTAAKSSAAV